MLRNYFEFNQIEHRMLMGDDLIQYNVWEIAIILPVFYKVKPSGVRGTGKDKDEPYAKAVPHDCPGSISNGHVILRFSSF